MIPHCPGQFKSKTTPQKLARRTYPGLQELYHRLQELRANVPVIVKKNPQRVLTTSARSFLCSSAFEPVGLCLEKLIADDDTLKEMTADGRVTLRTALSNAQYFAAVILMHFYERELLVELFEAPHHIHNGYSLFVEHFLTSVSYPCLRSRLQHIRIEKDELRNMCNKVVNKRFWERVVVHRVEDNGDGMEGKRIVLDPTDATRFPDDEFIHLYSETSHIIDSTTTQVEFHVLVSKECSKTDHEVQEIIAKRHPDTFVQEDWFFGAHVLNLDTIRQVREWMDAAVPILLKNVLKRRPVKRSVMREDKAVGKAGSVMVAVGENVDQNGYLRPPHNTPRMAEEARFELMQESDRVMDGVVFVSLFLLFTLTIAYEGCFSILCKVLEGSGGRTSCPAVR